MLMLMLILMLMLMLIQEKLSALSPSVRVRAVHGSCPFRSLLTSPYQFVGRSAFLLAEADHLDPAGLSLGQAKVVLVACGVLCCAVLCCAYVACK